MFNQQYLDDHDVIERYLADQLSETEREGFEAYFLQHPEVVQQINQTAKFKSALMDLHASGRLQPLLEFQARPQRKLGIVALALAALLAAAVIVGLLTR